MLAILQQSIAALSLSDVDGERLFFHKNIERNKFDFALFTAIPLRNPSNIYWTLDSLPLYSSFDKDFGPPNMGQLYRFCLYVKDSIDRCSANNKRFVFYSYETGDLSARTNAVFLVGAYAILVEKRSPSKVLTWFTPLINAGHVLTYLDVTAHHYRISLADCWGAIHRAKKRDLWPALEVQEIREYEHFDEVTHGDLNWIVKGKILALGSPVDTKYVTGDQPIGKTRMQTHEPSFYIPLFEQFGVSTVIRTCKPEYNSSEFVQAGLEFHELYFVDGSVPSMDIVNQFFEIVNHSTGTVAVHCKAGLGRTGTLICAYLMRYYGFTAPEAIAYVRIRRPGSVIGDQQTFLANIEPQLRGLYGTFEKKKRTLPDSTRDDFAAADDSDVSSSHEVIHAPKPKKKKLFAILEDELSNSSSGTM